MDHNASLIDVIFFYSIKIIILVHGFVYVFEEPYWLAGSMLCVNFWGI